MTLDDLCALLGSARFDLSSEGAAQRDVETLLAGSLPRGVWNREHRLSASERPDFVVLEDGGLIAIEMKGFRQQAAKVVRQLERYAAHEDVSALILLSNTALALGPAIGGKPLREVNMGRAWL